MITAQQLFANARSRVREVSASDLRKEMESGNAPIVIDVREQNEWNLGHVPGAMHISRGVLESNIEARVPRAANVVLYCASGNRSAMSALSLQEMGYTQVSSMAGGFKDWGASGGAVAD